MDDRIRRHLPDSVPGRIRDEGHAGHVDPELSGRLLQVSNARREDRRGDGRRRLARQERVRSVEAVVPGQGDELGRPRLPPGGVRQPPGDSQELPVAAVLGAGRQEAAPALPHPVHDRFDVPAALPGPALGQRHGRRAGLGGPADQDRDAGAGAAGPHPAALRVRRGLPVGGRAPAVDRLLGDAVLRLRGPGAAGGAAAWAVELGGGTLPYLRLGALGAEYGAEARAALARGAGRAREVLGLLLRGHRQALLRLLRPVRGPLLPRAEERRLQPGREEHPEQRPPRRSRGAAPRGEGSLCSEARHAGRRAPHRGPAASNAVRGGGEPPREAAARGLPAAGWVDGDGPRGPGPPRRRLGRRGGGARVQ
mmetsp:Transcript_56320/g.160388  ORF Transcript_56320/g.160388 Transcript_56320/m.160388 type:complete len:366 (-) Transcript_56320:2017-3114(-)